MLDNLTLAKHYFSELSEEQKRVFLREMNLTPKAKPKAKPKKELPYWYSEEYFYKTLRESWNKNVEARNKKRAERERKKQEKALKELLKDTGIEMN